MTYKMLNACLEAIAKRSHNKTAVLAGMHGIKLELYKKHKPISEETFKRAEVAVSQILAENQAKIGKR